MSRALLIQLARLGDLVQSLPVLMSLRSVFPEQTLDLLCPSPLVALGSIFPYVERTYPWNGEEWQDLATRKTTSVEQRLSQAKRYMSELAVPEYPVAYNLNNHPRGIFSANFFGGRVVGPGEKGPLNATLPAWAGYLRQIAQNRGLNRVHLADAFCGLCRVPPPSAIPFLRATEEQLPVDLERIVTHSGSMIVGIVLGAGDAERRIPLSVWQELIKACAEHIPQSFLFLIGGQGEREAALTLEHKLPPEYLNRVVNACGRTSLPQLVRIFNQCQWVIGSDTGPLHLGAMCGARAIGWYFSRARVHETGPYGEGHFVWQHESGRSLETMDDHGIKKDRSFFDHCPVLETVHLMRDENVDSTKGGWDLWTSHRDEWGAFYTHNHKPDQAVLRRKDMWKTLSQLTNQDFQMEVFN